MTDITGHVLGIYLQPAQRTLPQPVPAAQALVGHGLDGDVHGKKRPGDPRQVLIVDIATLRRFDLHPGDLREQITVAFAALEPLPAGTLLQAGEVTLELTGPCEPCTHIGGLNGVVDPIAFQKALDGRRGQLARVIGVEGEGRIRVGDRIDVRTPAPR